MTAQLRQTALARSTCSSAGPVVPTGKNSSGSSSRHAACWRQSMKNSLSRLVGGRFLGRNATLRRQHCGELHRERRIPPGTLSHIFLGDGLGPCEIPHKDGYPPNSNTVGGVSSRGACKILRA